MEEIPLSPLQHDDSDVGLANTEDLQERDLPGVVRMVLPIPLQNAAAERHRTPRMSLATTVEPSELQPAEEERGRARSPKRKTTTAEVEKDDAKAPRTTTASSSADARLQQPEDDQGLATAAATRVPAEGDDAFSVEVNIDKVIGKLPGGWKCVDGGFELDDIYYTVYRKGGQPKEAEAGRPREVHRRQDSRTFTILQQLGLGVCNS